MIVSVVGARPQFIKAAAVSRELRKRCRELIVNTGQHYDDDMARVFFDELGVPKPDVDLGVGSASHARQTAAMLVGIEDVLLRERPEAVLVYGDTNSTVAGALAAAKVGIPIAHVEAGLRSFKLSMPEEVNRVVTDHLSRWLFAPSDAARMQLEREGITRGVQVVGDVMLDVLRMSLERSSGVTVLERLALSPGGYLVATVHRAENTDDDARLRRLVDTLGRLGKPVVFPAHPRTRKALEALRVPPASSVRMIPPLGYLDMLVLTRSAACVLTDSGGLQKEAYWLRVPCVTFRDETEWIETVATGWNVTVGTDPGRIADAVAKLSHPPVDHPDLYGDGKAAELIAATLAA